MKIDPPSPQKSVPAASNQAEPAPSAPVSAGQPETYVMVFQPLKSHVPIDARLKGLLKISLRAFKMKCLECKPGKPGSKRGV